MKYRFQFTGPTGANAIEADLKLSRKVTGRQNIVSFTHGYHGLSLGAVAATSNRFHRAASGVSLSGVTFMPYDGYLGPSVDTADYEEYCWTRAAASIRQLPFFSKLCREKGG